MPRPCPAPPLPAVRRLRAPALLLVLLLAGPLRADDAALCEWAAQDAARLSGVPAPVLLAVSLTETGRGQPARPWPWTVNLEGEGHWFPTRAEAEAFAESARAQGRTSFDVGCFQLNWRWHGENFTSVAQMFDPLANASYAAGFLRTLRAEGGGWSEAAGAYHSRTPGHAARYRARFDDHLARLGGEGGALRLAEAAPPAAPPAASPAAGGSPRANSYPLFQPGAAAPRLGSLVPLDG
jgi:hypothetical protein